MLIKIMSNTKKEGYQILPSGDRKGRPYGIITLKNHISIAMQLR